LIDTGVFIWCLRGNQKAVSALEGLTQKAISVITRMELGQGSRNKKENHLLRQFLTDQEVRVIELSPEAGFWADAWMEQYHLAHRVGVADCLFAATASNLGLPLLTANARLFRCFPIVQVRKFDPSM